jgi:ligand-binding sensor domain-containing protein
MKILRFLLCAGVVLLGTCTGEKSNGYNPVRGAWVYDIKQHNDSIYFSTSESGIFSFHPDHPESVRRVGGCRRQPFRTFCFAKDNTLLASSYYAGVFYSAADTMLLLAWARYPAWAMKLDNEGKLWLACAQGILRQRGDSLVRFCGVRDAHDVAFFKDQVAVAHMKGISLYNRENGALVREYAKGLTCWSVTAYDTLLIGGGIERCLIISKAACREIRFGPPRNILWATALDGSGMLHCATQQGLFCARLSDTVAVCSGYKNICCKSVFIDNKGRIWAGLFKKSARWLVF